VINTHAHYEVKEGRLFVNGERVPLRRGVVYTALAKVGWSGHEGPLPADLVEAMLRLDRRISLMALARETEPAA
jgi:hypothetical protein